MLDSLIDQTLDDYVDNELNKTEADEIEEFYVAINELVADLNDSHDAIEDLLISSIGVEDRHAMLPSLL